jgi:hypothetical protein
MRVKGFLLLFITFTYVYNSFAQSKDSILKSNPIFRNWKDNTYITVSAGYGFPSLFRFLTKFEFLQYVYETKGYGPVHTKVECVYKNKVSAGVSLFYNNFYTKYRRSVDTLHYVYKDLSVQARINGVIIKRPKYQLYAGIGLGSVFMKNKTYAVAYTNGIKDTLLQTSLITSFDRTTLEAGIGYRYWIKPRFGIYSEIGIGRTILAFTRYGAIDSFIQGGLSLKLF